MTAPAIGLLGIGNIGTVFAECLLRTGHQVIGFSKPAPASFGGTLALSPRAVADAAPLVLCCLPDEAAATDAYFGDTGLLAGVHPGSIIADLAPTPWPSNSASPTPSRRLAASWWMAR